MSTPEDKQRKRQRIRNHIKKDLVRVNKHNRQRIKDNRKKDVKDLSHLEFVEIIQNLDKDDNSNT